MGSIPDPFYTLYIYIYTLRRICAYCSQAKYLNVKNIYVYSQLTRGLPLLHSEYSNYCFTDYDGIDLPVRGEFKLAVSTIQ